MKYIFTYLFLICLLFCFKAKGQEQYLKAKFMNYASLQGLDPEGVYVMEQDSIGKLWLGTAEGLYSFNGKKFIREDQGKIPTNNIPLEIEDLIADGQDRLWVGSNYGLWYRDDNLQFSHFLEDTDLADKKISTLFIDAEKKFLYAGFHIADTSGVLLQIDLIDLQYKRFEQAELPKNIRTIWQENNKSPLWIGGEQLFQLNTNSGHLQKLASPFPEINLKIEDIDKYEDQYLISTYGKGIFSFDSKTKKWFNHFYYDKEKLDRGTGNGVRDILAKNDSTFYLCTTDRGFGEFYPKSGRFLFYENNPADIRSIPITSARKVFVDRDENVWIGMYTALSFYNRKMRSIEYHTVVVDDLARKNYRLSDVATSKDGEIIVLGLRNHDFVLYDRNFEVLKNKVLKYDKEVKVGGGINLIPGTQNNILANDTRGGLVEIDLDDFTVKYAFRLDTIELDGKRKVLNSCRISPNGTIWITTFNKSVIRYNDRTGALKVIFIEKDPKKSYSTYEMGFTGGKIFVSSRAGIHQIIGDSIKAINLPIIDLKNNYIFSIAGLNDSLLAVGTSRSGLFLYNHKKDSLYHVSQEQGMLGSSIEELEKDQAGNIWGLTNKGIFVYMPEKERAAFYNTADGLFENRIGQFYIDSLPDGRMTVSTRNGINVFEPSQLVQHSKPNKISIASINEHNYYKSPTQITLPADRPYLNISFEDFEYKLSAQLQYFYRILPQQKDWQEITGEQKLSFPQLAPGNYVIEFRSENRWKESSPIRSLEVEVQVSFWKKPTFIIISVLFLLGLVAFITNLITRKREQEKALRERYEMEINEMELRALRAHMNPHFLFNSLNSIRYFIQNNDNKAANAYISKFSKLLRFILNHSNKNTVTLEEELDALKLYLEFEKLRFDDGFSYEINLSSDVNMKDILIQPLLLQPLIENAIWHGIMKAKASGKIKINVFQKEDQVQILIEDDGVGIDFENLSLVKEKRLGLSIVEKRIALFNAKNNLQIEYKLSNVNADHPTRKGTRVLMKIFKKTP